MVLRVSRPTKHPKTGIYWLRKRVPADLQQQVGRTIITKSLDTRDPEQAKRRHAEVLADLEARWARLKSGTRPISDREAHRLAQKVGDRFFSTFEENATQQLLWHPEIYDGMWSQASLPESEVGAFDPLAGEHTPGSIPLENILWRSMRKMCTDEARQLLVDHGFDDDEWSLHKTSRAVGVALQEASIRLRRLQNGGYLKAPAPQSQLLSALQPRSASSNTLIKAPPPNHGAVFSLTGLVEDWWKESKVAGRKPSTYESYRNTFSTFVRFLGHDDLSRVGACDVIGFKDHRLSTPSQRTGKVPSAKTVKDSDLAGLRTVFDWAIRNGRMTDNPALKISIRLSKPQRLRPKSFTDDEAVAILGAALAHKKGNENAKTAAAKKWVPWLSAFTGARVGELAQLRTDDVYQDRGQWVIRMCAAVTK